MSLFEIEVLTEVTVPASYQEVVRQAAASTLANEGHSAGAGCSILLTSDRRIRDLNRVYLGLDKVTDVLSFPAGEPTPGAPSYLGDIAISVATAEKQAVEAGHGVIAELQLLTVHAVLHLLGYDHDSDSRRERMWLVQAKVLEAMGSEITEPKII